MDVTSMIKVNALAKELVSKGIAPSSEEASKMAEQFLRKDYLPAVSRKADTYDMSSSMKTAAYEKPVSMKTEDYDKQEILMERMQRKFNSEIESLKEQLSIVINELNLMKQDISRAKSFEEESPASEAEQPQPSPEAKQTTLETKKEERAEPSKKTEPKQKTDELMPGDVKIEDYFYYGAKKNR